MFCRDIVKSNTFAKEFSNNNKMNRIRITARITEVDDASDQLITLYEQSAAVKGDGLLKTIFAEMKSLSDRITEAICRDKAESELESADALRDDEVRRLSSVINGYASMHVEALAKNGATLKRVFDKYGVKIVNESYASESSLIESLLGDLADEEVGGCVAALQGVPEAVAALRAAQDAFNNARLAYDSAKAQDRSTASATEIKRLLLACINQKLVAYLNVVRMSDAATYGEFAGLVEEEIERVNAAVASRTKRPDDDTETPTA